MGRKHRIKLESSMTFSFSSVSQKEIKEIKDHIKYLKRKARRTMKIDLFKVVFNINQKIERLQDLLAYKKGVMSLLGQLPPVIGDLVEDAVPVSGALAAESMPLPAPAIPMGLEIQQPEIIINPELVMTTPIAQAAPAAFPEFDEQAIPSAPYAPIIRTPENPPALVRYAPAAALFGLAPAIAVPATPQDHMSRTPETPPALEQPSRYLQRGLYTPLRQIITNPPTEPPPRKSLRALAPQMLSARA